MLDLNFSPGTTVGHFRIDKKLGEGGMGAIFLAEDLTLGRQVAIKFMNRRAVARQADPVQQENIYQRFIREAKSAATINHPNLAQIYEANFDTEHWYIAMELIGGGDLYDKIEKGEKYQLDDILSYFRQTVDGLKFAWENHKIIHRDIKPQNIMLTKANAIKIVDLGLAKPMTGTEDLNLTTDAAPVGTPFYMAPEQASGEDVNFLADIFALGVTMYEVCTGKKPFDHKSSAMIYMAQMNKQYTPIAELNDEIPPELCELIDTMLEPKPADRIQTYDEILEILNHLGNPLDLTGGTRLRAFRKQKEKVYKVDDLILSRYRVMKFIGQSKGGMVYICLDTDSKMDCAIKVLKAGREFPEDSLDIVHDNFKRLMSLSHANLVPIRDIRLDEKNQELYIVMEVLSGINMRQYTTAQIEQYGEVKFEQVAPILSKVADALDSLHQATGFIHNDIKPESIFLCGVEHMDVRILDYGITLGYDPDPEFYRLESVDYMSPEHWQKSSLCTQSDQYSFALTIYEMFARKLPYWLNDPEINLGKYSEYKEEEEQRYYAMKDRVLSDQPKALQHLSDNFSKTLFQALAKTPQKRFPNNSALIKALSGSQKGLGTGKIIAGIAALALIAAGISFGLQNKGETVIAPSKVDQTTINDLLTSDIKDSDKSSAQALAAEKARQAELEKKRTEELKRQKELEAKLSAEQKKKQAEQVQAKMIEDIKNFKKAFETRYSAIKAKPLAEKVLPTTDKLLSDVSTALKEQKIREALSAYKIAFGKLDDTQSELDTLLATESQRLSDDIVEKKKALAKWMKWDISIAEKMVPVDTSFALANESFKSQSYDRSYLQYDKLVKNIEKIDQHIQETFTPKEGKSFTLGKIQMSFVWVPALKYWVGQFEVTNGQYHQFKAAHSSGKFKQFDMNGDKQPVCQVSYLEAISFCSWINELSARQGILPEGVTFRLPSKKEWIAIASCGDDRKYPWGNEWPATYGNFGNYEIFPKVWKLQGFNETHPTTCNVEKSGKNEWNIYGLAGNVWEWTSEKNSKSFHAVCGGGWDSCDKRLTQVDVGRNAFANPVEQYDNIGFRIILAPTTEN